MFTIYLFTKENFLNNKDLRKAPRIRQDTRQSHIPHSIAQCIRKHKFYCWKMLIILKWNMFMIYPFVTDNIFCDEELRKALRTLNKSHI